MGRKTLNWMHVCIMSWRWFLAQSFMFGTQSHYTKQYNLIKTYHILTDFSNTKSIYGIEDIYFIGYSCSF